MQGQDFGFSEESSFVTGPEVGPDAVIKVLANADMGHVEPDGSNEFEYDRNQRLVSWKNWPYCVLCRLHQYRASGKLAQRRGFKMWHGRPRRICCFRWGLSHTLCAKYQQSLKIGKGCPGKPLSDLWGGGGGNAITPAGLLFHSCVTALGTGC